MADDVSVAEALVSDAIGDVLRQPQTRFDRETELSVLGFDALDRVELALALDEHLAFELVGEAAWQTVGDVIDAVHSAVERGAVG